MRFRRQSLTLLVTLALALPAAWAGASDRQHLGAHLMRDGTEFQGVIERRCISCHTRELVEEAVTGKQLEDIQRHMIERGAVLSEQDKKVLGTFWGEPLPGKKEAPVAGHAVTREGYQRFQQVLQTRCTGCHTLERVEESITARSRYESVLEQMLRRGATLSEEERNTLRSFWGETDPGR